ncbi:MAG: bifunctional pyr operon transcriptional regulator/uracil phosphoribosyltransferase PyrR [Caldimicrobium sp.]|nr:bifunctional pyr operon transcriptional regulator/uracil phosphoribosyltransferase PyrR [Caldimicrobium sp.]MCX7874032.1 bifunctional pyr operon transcriptional regulator/uracil phosphoribosyltransferase PyrR [Caldimicrobium sp.]MDW8093856.1 bifunctional pyr operon transcriptional regulator/uracil phosphoribosyltransferase PyrR [Caldimicrobium sp.]
MKDILTQKAKKVIAGPKKIENLLEKLAQAILKAHPLLENIVLVGIRCGGVPVTNRLKDIFLKKKGVSIPVGYLDITLYRDDWTRITQYPEVRKTEIPFSIEDKNVILVDDVIFTGRTVRAAMDALIDLGRPKKIELAVLVDRGGREFPIEPTYQAIKIKSLAPYDYVSVYFRELHGRDQICLESR